MFYLCSGPVSDQLRVACGGYRMAKKQSTQLLCSLLPVDVNTNTKQEEFSDNPEGFGVDLTLSIKGRIFAFL